MNLSEKPCYPLSLTTIDGQAMDNVDYDKSKETSGITFRERLIIALASSRLVDKNVPSGSSVEMIIETADKIIKEMQK